MASELAMTVTGNSRSRWLAATLWTAQVLLAIFYVFVGSAKLTQPIAALTAMMAWPGVVPEALVRVIGAAEVAGALGLVLPSLLRVLPVLTPFAAVGLAVLQVFAMIFHLARGEELMMWPANIVLLAIALFILWGRTRKIPIAPR